MSVQGDNLKIPIEIKTDDLNEIRKLINEITEAETDLKSIKPRKGKGKGDDSSRSAFTQQDDTKGGGIFGGQDKEALPTQGRDKSSKTPIQKENQFAKMQQDVAAQGEKLSGMDKLKGGVGTASQTIGFASLLGQGGGAIAGRLGAMASKAFLPLALVTTVIEIASGVLKAMLAPGGILDRRFRREAKMESTNLSSLKEKAEFTNGRRIIRVTTIGGQRGTGSQSRSNLDYIKNGVDVYDINGVLNKGIGAGTI